MQTFQIDTTSLNSTFANEQVDLLQAAPQICEAYRIPKTLLDVDKKYNLSTAVEVLRFKTPTLDVVEDDGCVAVLDQNTDFFVDDTYSQILTECTSRIGNSPRVERDGLTLTAIYDIPQMGTDFMGDLFNYQFLVVRRPNGGIEFSVRTLRLVCTNGMRVTSKEARPALVRRVASATKSIGTYFNLLNNLDPKTTLENLFMVNGNPVQASVNSVMKLADTCKKYAPEGTDDLVDSRFFIPQIAASFSNQGLDLNALSQRRKSHLLSGMTMYEASNIATAFARELPNPLAIHVEIGKIVDCQKRDEFELPSYEVPIINTDSLHVAMGDTLQ